MKKALKCLSFVVLALAMLVMPFAFTTKTVAHAEFADIESRSYNFEDNAMEVVFSNETLIGVDKDGWVYTATNNNDLVKSGHQFNAKRFHYVVYNGAFSLGANKLLCNHDNTTIYAGSDGTTSTIYKSTDNGTSWTPTVLGNKTTTGSPIALVYGNERFALMTAVDNGSGTLVSASIYYSVNGTDWQLAINNIPLDYMFSFNGGYFFRTEYSRTNNPIVYYSSDLVNWGSFTSPIGIEKSNGSYINPALCIAKINNMFYMFGFGKVYRANAPQNLWSLMFEAEDIKDTIYVKPYQNGAIFCTENNVIYADVGQSGLENIETLDVVGSQKKYYQIANTVAESQTRLCVGYSNFDNYWSSSTPLDSNKYAHFKTFNKQIKHEVRFLDWNGAELSKIEVVDGQHAIEPQTPTRAGYHFVGWDKDIQTTVITADTTFNALYERNTCTVTFKDNLGNTLKTITLNEGGIIDPETVPETPTYDDMVFSHWTRDLSEPVTTNVTISAVYTNICKLTLSYRASTGIKFGADSQFEKTAFTTKVFEFEKNSTDYKFDKNLNEFIEQIKQISNGNYDFDFVSITLPDVLDQNITVTADYEENIMITLRYYSQVRFPYKKTAYYYPCLVYVTRDVMYKAGDEINIEDFKLNYFEYEDYEGKRPFYNNLYNFEFLGWDKEFETVTKAETYTGNYKIPQVHIYYYDSEMYLADEQFIDTTLIPIEDIEKVDGWSRFVNGVQNFFSGRWKNLVEDALDAKAFDEYVRDIAKRSKPNVRVLMPFIIPNVNIPKYNSFFSGTKCAIEGKNMVYVDGDYSANDMRFFIDTVAFSNNMETLTMTCKYETALDSSFKAVNTTIDKVAGVINTVFAGIGNVFKNNWKTFVVIAVIALAVIVVIIIIKKASRNAIGGKNLKTNKRRRKK